MPNIVACIVDDHALWLVALAAALCVCGCGAYVFTVRRMRQSRRRPKVGCALAAALMAYTVWATHFVAMVGYKFTVAVGYNIIITALSGFAILAAAFGAQWLASSGETTARRVAAGALFGGGVAAMHYIGMMALQLPLGIHWSVAAVCLSIGVAVLFGVLGFHLLFSAKRWGACVGAAVAFVVAIAGLHFTGMSAMTFYSMPQSSIPRFWLDDRMLAVSIGFSLIFVAAGVLSMTVGHNPRQLWRRNAIAMGMLGVMAVAIYGVHTYSANERAVFAELSRLVAEQQAWRADLALAAIQHNDAVADALERDERPPRIDPKVGQHLATYRDNDLRIAGILAGLKKANLNIAYFGDAAGKASFVRADSLQAHTRELYLAMRSQIQERSERGVLADFYYDNIEADNRVRIFDFSVVDLDALEAGYLALANRVVAEAHEATEAALRIERLALFGGAVIFIFQGLAVFLPAHRTIVRSLTELEAEKAAAERTALAAEHATDSISITDVESRLIWGNAAFVKSTGLDIEDCVGTKLDERLVGQGTDLNLINQLNEARAKGEKFTVDVELQRVTGEPYWVSLSTCPVPGDPEGAQRSVNVARNITKHKKLEFELTNHRDNLAKLVEERTQTIQNQSLELENALAAERELNEMQTEFVSMASHEFRTPLTIIDGVARRIEKRADTLGPEELRERAGSIRAAIKRMTMLVERTLDASRLSSGRMKLAPDDFDPKQLVFDVCARQQELAPGHTISIDIDAYPDNLYGDGRLMDNVYTNLLSNAVKYSQDNPKVEVRGWVEADMAVLTVRDYGVGIAKDELPKIFERFFRAKTSVGISGTGIGLNLVKNLVDLHHGYVFIDSEEGQWTEITVKLPIESPLREEFASSVDGGGENRSLDGDADLALSA